MCQEFCCLFVHIEAICNPYSRFHSPIQKLDGIFSPPVLSRKSKLGIQQYNVLVKKLGSEARQS